MCLLLGNFFFLSPFCVKCYCYLITFSFPQQTICFLWSAWFIVTRHFWQKVRWCHCTHNKFKEKTGYKSWIIVVMPDCSFIIAYTCASTYSLWNLGFQLSQIVRLESSWLMWPQPIRSLGSVQWPLFTAQETFSQDVFCLCPIILNQFSFRFTLRHTSHFKSVICTVKSVLRTVWYDFMEASKSS